MTVIVGGVGGGAGGGSGAISGGFKIFELMFNQSTGAALPAGETRPAIFTDKTAMISYFTSKPSEFDRFIVSGRVCEIGTVDSQGKPLTINNEAYSYVSGQPDPYVNVVGGLVGATGQKGDDGVSVTDAKIESNGHLDITLSDGTVIDAGNAKGEKGDPGSKLPHVLLNNSEGQLNASSDGVTYDLANRGDLHGFWQSINPATEITAGPNPPDGNFDVVDSSVPIDFYQEINTAVTPNRVKQELTVMQGERKTVYYREGINQVGGAESLGNSAWSIKNMIPILAQSVTGTSAIPTRVIKLGQGMQADFQEDTATLKSLSPYGEVVDIFSSETISSPSENRTYSYRASDLSQQDFLWLNLDVTQLADDWSIVVAVQHDSYSSLEVFIGTNRVRHGALFPGDGVIFKKVNGKIEDFQISGEKSNILPAEFLDGHNVNWPNVPNNNYTIESGTFTNWHPTVDGKQGYIYAQTFNDNFVQPNELPKVIHRYTFFCTNDDSVTGTVLIKSTRDKSQLPTMQGKLLGEGGTSTSTKVIGWDLTTDGKDRTVTSSESNSNFIAGVSGDLPGVGTLVIPDFNTLPENSKLSLTLHSSYKEKANYAVLKFKQQGGNDDQVFVSDSVTIEKGSDKWFVTDENNTRLEVSVKGATSRGDGVTDPDVFEAVEAISFEDGVAEIVTDSVTGRKVAKVTGKIAPSAVVWHPIINNTTLGVGDYIFTNAKDGDLFTYNWDNNEHSEVIPLSLVKAKNNSYIIPSTGNRLHLKFVNGQYLLTVSATVAGIGGIGYTTGMNTGGDGGDGFPDNGITNNLTDSFENLKVGKWYVDGWENSSGLPDWDNADRVAVLTVFGGYDDTANGAFWMLGSHRKGIYSAAKSSGVTSDWLKLDGASGTSIIKPANPIEVQGKDGTNHDAIGVTSGGKLSFGTASPQITETEFRSAQRRFSADVLNEAGTGQTFEQLAYLSDITKLENPAIQWQRIMDAEPIATGTYILEATDKITGKVVKSGDEDWLILTYISSEEYTYSVPLGMVRSRKEKTGQDYDLYTSTVRWIASENHYVVDVSQSTNQKSFDFSINGSTKIELAQTVINKGDRGKRTLYVRGEEYIITPEDIQKDIIIQAEPFVKDANGHYSTTVTFPSLDVIKTYYYIPKVNEDKKDILPHIMDLNIQCWLDPEEGRKGSEHRLYLKSDGDSIAWETTDSIGDEAGCFIRRPANDTERNDYVSFNFMHIEVGGGDTGKMMGWSAQSADADHVYPLTYNPPPFSPSDEEGDYLVVDVGNHRLQSIGDTVSLSDLDDHTTQIITSQPIVDGFPFRPYAYVVDAAEQEQTYETIASESEVVSKDKQEIINVIDDGYYIIQPNTINWKFEHSQEDIQVTLYKNDVPVYNTNLQVAEKQTYFQFNNPAFVFKATDDVNISITDSFYNPLGILGRFGVQKIQFKYLQAETKTLAYEGEGGNGGGGDLPLNPTFETVTLESINDTNRDKFISLTGQDLNIINYQDGGSATVEANVVAVRTNTKSYVFDDNSVDVNDTRIINVGDGVDPHDAVNLSQLNSKVSGGLLEVVDFSVSTEDTELGQDFMFKNVKVLATSDTASLILDARNLLDKSVIQLTLNRDNPYPVIRVHLISATQTATYFLVATSTFATNNGEWEMLSDARPTFSTIKPTGRVKSDFIPITAILAGDNMTSSIDAFGVLRLDVVGGGSGHSFNFADDTIVKVEGEVPVATELSEKDGDLSVSRSIRLSDYEIKSIGEKVSLAKKPLVTQELDSFGAVKRPKILHEELSGHSYLSESGQSTAYSYPLGQEITVESDFSHLRIKPDTIGFYPDNNYSGIVFRILDQNGLEVFNLKEYRAMTEGIRHTVEHPNIFLRSNKAYSFIVTNHEGDVLSLRGAFGIQSWLFDYQEQSEKELITADDIVQPSDPVYASVTSPVVKEKTGNAQLTFNPAGQIEVTGHLDLADYSIFNVKEAKNSTSAPNLGQVITLIQDAEFDSGVNFDGEYVENIVTDDTISAAYNAETKTMSISAIGTPPDGGSVFPIITPDQMTGYLVEFGTDDGTAIRTSRYTGKHLADMAIAAQDTADSANTKAIAADATAGTALAATATNSGVLTRHTVEIDRMRLEIDANGAGLLSLQRGHTQTRRELQGVEVKQKNHHTSIVALEAHAETIDTKTDGMVELIESNQSLIGNLSETTDANFASIIETMDTNFAQTETLITALAEGNFDSVQIGVEGAQGTVNINESSINAQYTNQQLRTDEKLQLGVTADGVTDTYLLMAAGSINATAKQIKNVLDATEDQDVVTLGQLNDKLDVIFDKISAIEDFIGMIQPPSSEFTVYAGRTQQAQVDANTISSLTEYQNITAATLLTNSDNGYDIGESPNGTFTYSVIAYPKGVLSPDPKFVFYNNLPAASRNSYEVVINNVVYIVLVPDWADAADVVINYTLGQ